MSESTLLEPVDHLHMSSKQINTFPLSVLHHIMSPFKTSCVAFNQPKVISHKINNNDQKIKMYIHQNQQHFNNIKKQDPPHSVNSPPHRHHRTAPVPSCRGSRSDGR